MKEIFTAICLQVALILIAIVWYYCGHTIGLDEGKLLQVQTANVFYADETVLITDEKEKEYDRSDELSCRYKDIEEIIYKIDVLYAQLEHRQKWYKEALKRELKIKEKSEPQKMELIIKLDDKRAEAVIPQTIQGNQLYYGDLLGTIDGNTMQNIIDAYEPATCPDNIPGCCVMHWKKKEAK